MSATPLRLGAVLAALLLCGAAGLFVAWWSGSAAAGLWCGVACGLGGVAVSDALKGRRLLAWLRADAEVRLCRTGQPCIVAVVGVHGLCCRIGLGCGWQLGQSRCNDQRCQTGEKKAETGEGHGAAPDLSGYSLRPARRGHLMRVNWVAAASRAANPSSPENRGYACALY